MAQFIHHPDGFVVVTDNSGNHYKGSLLEFTEFIEKLGGNVPFIPDGFVGRVYSPGSAHFLYNACQDQFPAELDWSDGNFYINQAAVLVVMQAERIKQLDGNPDPYERPKPKTPEQIRQEQIQQLTNSYLSYIKELDGYLLAAIAEDDLQTQEDIKTERAAVKADYFIELQAILSGQL